MPARVSEGGRRGEGGEGGDGKGERGRGAEGERECKKEEWGREESGRQAGSKGVMGEAVVGGIKGGWPWKGGRGGEKGECRNGGGARAYVCYRFLVVCACGRLSGS